MSEPSDFGNTDGFSPTDADCKLRLLKQIFDHIVNMGRHQDEKAGRILSAMAFLTVAYATFFAGFLDSGVVFRFLSHDLIIWPFICYVFCVTVGSILTILAFGPRYPEIPKPRQGKKETEDSSQETRTNSTKSSASKAPLAIFFFEQIVKQSQDEWEDYFSNSHWKDLEQKAVHDLTVATYSLAKRLTNKIEYIRWARRLFFLAMCFFLLGTLLGGISVILEKIIVLP